MVAGNDTNHMDIETLMDYVDGKLDESIRESVETHLNDCEACRQRVGEMRRLSSLWDRWNFSEYSEGVWLDRADACESHQDREGAIAAVGEALEVHRSREDRLPSEEAVFLLRLARLERAGRNWEAAEGHYRKALEIQRGILGETDPSHIETLHRLVNMYLEMEAFEHAEVCMDEIQRIMETLPPAPLPDAAETSAQTANSTSVESKAKSDVRQGLSTVLERSLQAWLKRENRPEVKALLEDLASHFKEGVSGAFRIVAGKGGLALEQMGEVLSPERHWRFGYAGAVSLGGGQPESPEPQRKIHAVWTRDNRIVRESMLDVTYDEARRSATLDLSLLGPFAALIVYENTLATGVWNATLFRAGEQPAQVGVPALDEKIVLLKIVEPGS